MPSSIFEPQKVDTAIRTIRTSRMQYLRSIYFSN